MKRKSNEQEIKTGLLVKFEKIAEKNGNSITIPGRDGTKIAITTEYSVDEFGFSPGQFIQVEYDYFSFQSWIGLCVGVGKGCPHDSDREEVWFLLENDKGVSHFCNHKARKFKFLQDEGRIILLDPVSAG